MSSSLVVFVVGATGVLPENGYLAATTAHKAAATGTLPEDGYLAAVAERLWQRQPLPGAPTTTTNNDDTDCHRLRIKIGSMCFSLHCSAG